MVTQNLPLSKHPQIHPLKFGAYLAENSPWRRLALAFRPRPWARVDGPGSAPLFEQQHFVTKRVIFVWFAEGISIGIYNYNML